MKERLQEVARQKGLRLSQVNLIEKHLAEIKKAGKISKDELNKIKKEVEQKIDFVLNGILNLQILSNARNAKEK